MMTKKSRADFSGSFVKYMNFLGWIFDSYDWVTVRIVVGISLYYENVTLTLTTFVTEGYRF